MEKDILKTNNLTKKYGDFIALDNVNVNIKEKDIYGLIGRNGAGKTTLMRVISTLTSKTSGSFNLFNSSDNDITETKKRIGCLIETPAFFPNLTAYGNLKYYSIQKGITDLSKITKALEIVNLNNTGKKKFKTFSLGMKQRLGIAFAILDNPDFIILDEPINGLDPIGIGELRDTFKRLNEKENMTILISSHILSELYLVATKFGFIENGKLVKELTKEELDIECSKTLVIKTPNIKKATSVIEKYLKTNNYKLISNNEIRLFDYLDNPAKVTKSLCENDVDVMSIYETGLSLEEYFKEVVKEVNND